MTDKNKQLEAAIIVQGYLLEILLLNRVHQQPDPIQTLDLIRFQVKTQLEDDLQKELSLVPVSAELKRAIAANLGDTFDRAAGQLERPAPPRHHA